VNPKRQTKPSQAELSEREHVDEPRRLRITRPPTEQGQRTDLHSATDAKRPKDQPEPAIVILHRHSLSSESCLRAESDIQQRCDVPIAEVNDSTVGSVLLNDAAHIEEGDL
jgi:hypothetical protein